MLHIHQLSGGYLEVPVVKDVSFEVQKGEMLGILGPNGSGKSTLLKVISGILPARTGSITLNGAAIETFSTKELARQMAVLPQLHAHAFTHSVRETVSLGRYPHQTGWFSSWSAEDEAAVVEAMKLTDVLKYEHTSLDQLSGGEQQRVFVAQASAQQAPLLLLDEPTNHLDIAHQTQLLDTIKKQCIEKGMTIISVFHDINLASLYCDRLLLMENGSIKHLGEPHVVIKDQQIENVYKARVSTHPHPEQPKPQITLMPNVQKLQTDFWVNKSNFRIEDEYVLLQSAHPLKTVSSAVVNAGSGWYRTFINRCVPPTYDHENIAADMFSYLQTHGFIPTDTVGMMTAISPSNVEIADYPMEFGSITIAVTAGVGNAIDVSKSFEQDRQAPVGTINTWIIINGNLSEEAFIQAMITATEAKTKALYEQQILDPFTGTLATGTPTDSLLVAATQQGQSYPYAGPVTELGKVIGRGVFECTVKAIQKTQSSTA
ncbi:adenosylcobinamide amidohydrolase [Paenisporosarcina quisquiliarum]|uniref:Adenosylcobinamide amidohydrolase n=1 Tax=Paenisporosarcina quisquiliarum TaxID=365346 RepID=A0A9X3LIF2_9BACL|nr:adenosylcobinamide amidohydrolase [Paenisporosarcina quisquiliarum]MCZ8538595.1 adenosylcobinamide amidohydrolase [Paenisporosarcina quisquiliarum]